MIKNIRKIAFVSNHDTSDVHSWSGTGYYMPRSLEKQGFQIKIVDKLILRSSLFDKIKSKIYCRIYKRKFHIDRQPSVIKSYALQLNERLKEIDYDLIFSLGTLPIAFLKADKPIVFWTDANFEGMINYYSEFTNLSSETIVNGNLIEQLALDKCKLAIYSSEWAADTAIKNYNVDPSKIKIVPLGANLDSERTKLEIEYLIEKKSFEKCKLLFSGVDWARKGGNIAVKIAEELIKSGINTELNVVGCNPEISGSIPDFLKIYGFISKSSTEGWKFIEKMYEETHFLLLPSRTEAYGLVFAEANSFGIPCIATKTGGITSIIKDNVNGKTFELDAYISEYSNYIKSIFTNPDRYKKFCMDSYLEFKKRLNWDFAGESVKKLLDEI
jgi:glycosyltransferase involved in cell wall biosynthesis